MGHATEPVARLFLNGWAYAGVAVPAFWLVVRTNGVLPAGGNVIRVRDYPRGLGMTPH